MNLKFLKSIKVQISVFYLTGSMVAICLMGIILYYSIFSIELKQNLNYTKTTIDKSGNYIELYINKMKTIENILSQSSEVLDYLRDGDKTKKEANIIKLINNTLSLDSSIKSIILVGKDGRFVSNESNLNMNNSRDMMSQPWYRGALRGKNMVTLTGARMQSFSMDKENWVISISQEIRDENGNNLGVVLIDIEYHAIENFLKDLNNKSSSYAFILNEENQVVYNKDTRYFEDDRLRDKLISIKNMAQGYDDKAKLLTQSYKIKDTNWTLVGVSTLSELAKIKRNLIETIIFVGIFLMVIIIYSGIYFANRITRPIAMLEKSMQGVEDGLYKIETSENAAQEVQNLSINFNNMIEKIKKLMNEIKENEEHLRKSEINALHSQINPHFLYNTLDSIVWMAELNEGEKVVDMTKALAQFFRLSLNAGSDITTVAKEFLHVKQYLYIQKIRYSNKLHYELNLDPTIGEIEILKIILQPIVENAIYHGIRNKDVGGTIKISGEKVGSCIQFIVSDDGVGFDISNLTKSTNNEKLKLGGVGIKNVDSRIKLFYGQEYGVDVISEIGKGTKVIIKLLALP